MERSRIYTPLDTERLGDEADALLTFLKSRVLFQDEALSRLAEAYDLAASPLKQSGGTLLQMMFAGSSGVGKTETVRALAEFLFGHKQAMTKIDCGDLTDHYDSTMLIGSTAGYLGYDHPNDPKHSNPPRFSQKIIDKPARSHLVRNLKFIDPKKYGELEVILAQLKEARKDLEVDLPPDKVDAIDKRIDYLKRQHDKIIEEAAAIHPLKSIILLDELEKAHPSIHDLILPILDEGRIEMANGESTSFENSIVIMTSNVGSREIANSLRGKRPIGFGTQNAKESIRDIAMRSVRKNFSPEFMGRISGNVIIFDPLNRSQRRVILNHKFRQLQRFCNERFPVEIVVSEPVFRFILNLCEINPEEGARMLEKNLHKYVTAVIGRLINSGQIDKNDRVVIGMNDGQITAALDTTSAIYDTFDAPEIEYEADRS